MEMPRSVILASLRWTCQVTTKDGKLSDVTLEACEFLLRRTKLVIRKMSGVHAVFARLRGFKDRGLQVDEERDVSGRMIIVWIVQHS